MRAERFHRNLHRKEWVRTEGGKVAQRAVSFVLRWAVVAKLPGQERRSIARGTRTVHAFFETHNYDRGVSEPLSTLRRIHYRLPTADRCGGFVWADAPEGGDLQRFRYVELRADGSAWGRE